MNGVAVPLGGAEDGATVEFNAEDRVTVKEEEEYMSSSSPLCTSHTLASLSRSINSQ